MNITDIGTLDMKREYRLLVVNGPRMSTIRAFIKDSLSFIDRSHLHSVKADLWMTTLDAWFLDSGSCGFLRSSKESLFFITFRPEGHWSIGRARYGRRQLWKTCQVGTVVTYYTIDGP